MNQKIDSSYFSLIELLVVISIISILASILLPALKKAKEQGQAITCANNLKNAGTAFSMYAMDYDEWFPYSVRTEGSVYMLWTNYLAPYMGLKQSGTALTNHIRDNSTIFTCPSARNNHSTSIYHRTYSMSYYTGPTYDSWDNSYDPMYKISDSSSGAALVADGNWEYRNDKLKWQPEMMYNHLPEFPHNRMTNFLFGDMHVDRVAYVEIPRDRTSAEGKSSGLMTDRYIKL